MFIFLNKFKQTKKINFALFIFVVLVSFSFTNSVFGWTAPTLTPPGGNRPSPLNTSSTEQIKEGNLIVVGNTIITGNINLNRLGGNNEGDIIGANRVSGYDDLILRGADYGLNPADEEEIIWIDDGTGAGSGKIVFKTNKLERMRITTAGFVGINTDNPGYALDVDGSINFTGTLYQGTNEFATGYWTQTGSDIYYTTGSVGIGTATPSSSLEVAGATSSFGTFGVTAHIMTINSATNNRLTLNGDATFDAISTSYVWKINGTEEMSLGTTALTMSANNNIILSGTGKLMSNYSTGVSGMQIEPGDSTVSTLRYDADRFRLYGGQGALEALTLFSGSPVRVGINNATPAYTLDVGGTLKLLSGTSINEFSIDGTLVGDSDDAVPTEKAVKAYVDSVAGSGLSGTGSAGQATFWTDSTTLSGDSNFYWDNANKRLGIGTIVPTTDLEIGQVGDLNTSRSIRLQTTNSAYYADITVNHNSGNAFNISQHGYNILQSSGDAYAQITYGASGTQKHKFDNGTVEIDGSATIGGDLTVSGGSISLSATGVGIIKNNSADQYNIISGGTESNLGANIILRGQSHASANQFEFRASGTTIAVLGASGNLQIDGDLTIGTDKWASAGSGRYWRFNSGDTDHISVKMDSNALISGLGIWQNATPLADTIQIGNSGGTKYFWIDSALDAHFKGNVNFAGGTTYKVESDGDAFFRNLTVSGFTDISGMLKNAWGTDHVSFTNIASDYDSADTGSIIIKLPHTSADATMIRINVGALSYVGAENFDISITTYLVGASWDNATNYSAEVTGRFGLTPQVRFMTNGADNEFYIVIGADTDTHSLQHYVIKRMDLSYQGADTAIWDTPPTIYTGLTSTLDADQTVAIRTTAVGGSYFNVDGLTVISALQDDGFFLKDGDGLALARLTMEQDGGRFNLYDGGSIEVQISVRDDQDTYFNAANDVGIGTTNPLAKLEVRRSASENTLFIANNDYASGSIGSGLVIKGGAASGDTYTLFQAIKTGGQAYADITLNASGGNVGVGVTTPTSKLHVVKNNDATVYPTALIRGYHSDWTDPYVVLDVVDGWEKAKSGSNAIVLKARAYDDTAGFNVLGNGRVGIGTTSPDSKLEIMDNDDSYIEMLKLSNTNTTHTINSGVGINFQLSTDYQDYKKAEIRAIATSASANDIALTFWSGGSTVGDHAERMRIQHNGYIGIGTVSPAYKFEVAESRVGDYAAKIRNSDMDGYGLLVMGGYDSGEPALMVQSKTGIERFYVYGNGDAWLSGDLTVDGAILGGVSGQRNLIGNNVFTSGVTGYKYTDGILLDGSDRIIFSREASYTTNRAKILTDGYYSLSFWYKVENWVSGTTIAVDINDQQLSTFDISSNVAWTFYSDTINITQNAYGFLDFTGTFSADITVSDIVVMRSPKPSQHYIPAPEDLIKYNATGRVGIGTTVPYGQLDITTGGEGKMYFSSSGGWNFFQSSNSGGTGAQNLRITGASVTDIPNLRIDADILALMGGNVGIGTSAPSSKMHLSTTSSGTNIKFQSGYANVGATYSSQYLVLGDNVEAYEGSVSKMVISNTHASGAGSAIIVMANDGIEFHTTPNAAVTAGDDFSSLSMKITKDGKVSLGIVENARTIAFGNLQSADHNLKYHYVGTCAAASAQAKRFEIMRVGLNWSGWDNSSIITVKLRGSYPDNYYKEYAINVGYDELENVELKDIIGSSGHLNDIRLVLGSKVFVAATNYYYYPVYVDVDNYTKVSVLVEHAMDEVTDSTPAGGIYFYDDPTGSDIASFAETEQLIIGSSQVDTNYMYGDGEITGNFKVEHLTFENDGGSPNTYLTDGDFGISDGGSRLSFWAKDGSTTYERVTMMESGRVGIGTTSPSGVLHIKKDVYGPKLILDDTNTANKVPMEFRSNGVIKWEFGQRPTAESYNFVFYNYDGPSPGAYYPQLTFQKTTGNVGIGDSTPSYKLDVNGTFAAKATSGSCFGSCTDASRALSILNSGMGNGSISYLTLGKASSTRNQGEVAYYHAGDGSTSNRLYFGFHGVAVLQIRADGRVGIGDSTPSQALDVAGSIRLTGSNYINTTSPTVYFQDTDHRSAMVHVNSNIWYVLRGSANNSTTWAQTGGYWPLQISLETNAAQFGGTVTATAFYYHSDRNLKKDIEKLDSSSIQNLLSLDPVKFRWKENNEIGLGFIAQDLEKIYPELVSENTVTDPETGDSMGDSLKSINYVGLIAPLVKTVQEQNERINELEDLHDKQQEQIRLITEKLYRQ